MSAPGFTGSTLDRVDAARHDPALVAAMREAPGARLLRLDGLDPVLDEQGGLLTLPLSDATDVNSIAMLGRFADRPLFVELVPGVSAARRSSALFQTIGSLAPADAATWATARSLVDWHARNGFCANCGTATAPFRAGWGRRCPACGTEHFPRTDPVVIMLAEHGEGDAARVLVGRQPGFPPGRYSALAGFLEPGEAIEEAVARELMEEAGLAVGHVRYVASQPWPFPSQLMIACVASVAHDDITLDRYELEDAMWVTRTQIGDALAEGADARFLPPPPYAIAHTLLTRWLAGET